MKTLKKIGVMTMLVGLVTTLLAPPMASAASNSDDNDSGKFTAATQQALSGQYRLTAGQWSGIKIDSNLTRDQALADNKVAPANLDRHMKMRPYLRILPVIYHGYDAKIHFGQIVVHQYLAEDMAALFAKMFTSGFPIKSVIPESQFGYVDENSMLANNSSGYRPGSDEHGLGAAVDINTFTNPFDTSGYNGNPIDPPGAHYDPAAKGAITMEGSVRKAWTARGFEWGGNWGNPNADPQKDFYKVGYFDYQHFQLSDPRYTYFHAHLPAGV